MLYWKAPTLEMPTRLLLIWLQIFSDVPPVTASAKTSRPTTDVHNTDRGSILPGTSDTADESVINLLTNVPMIEAPSGFEGGIGKSNSFIKNPS